MTPSVLQLLSLFFLPENKAYYPNTETSESLTPHPLSEALIVRFLLSLCTLHHERLTKTGSE